jgi:hypothetical protein
LVQDAECPPGGRWQWRWQWADLDSAMATAQGQPTDAGRHGSGAVSGVHLLLVDCGWASGAARAWGSKQKHGHSMGHVNGTTIRQHQPAQDRHHQGKQHTRVVAAAVPWHVKLRPCCGDVWCRRRWVWGVVHCSCYSAIASHSEGRPHTKPHSMCRGIGV